MNSMNGNNPRNPNFLFDFTDSKKADQDSIAFGLPEQQLMGQAALASMYLLKSHGRLQLKNPRERLIVLAGNGNNGGDGLALVYMLLGENPSWKEKILVYRPFGDMSPTGEFYLNQLKRAGQGFRHIEEFYTLEVNPEDTIVEALLGTGQHGELRDPFKGVLSKVLKIRAEEKRPFYAALDLPAGLNETDSIQYAPPGSMDGLFAAPDQIHSYGVDKLALRLNGSLAAYSKIFVLPMGFFPLSTLLTERFVCLLHDTFQPSFFIKKENAHKYESGHGLIIGGSRGMEGASALAARSFFAAGGGILHALLPEERSRELLLSSLPSVMFRTLSEGFHSNVIPASVLVGPGLSPDDLTKYQDNIIALLKKIVSPTNIKSNTIPFIILDAGAAALIKNKKYTGAMKERTLITPHTGEFISLGGRSIRSTMDFYEAVDHHKKNIGVHTIIKDSITIYLPGNREEKEEKRLTLEHGCNIGVYSRPQKNLSTAGSGDSLGGILLAGFARRRTTDISVAQIIAQSLLLHDRAAEKVLHPMSQDFAELIVKALDETPSTSNVE